MVSKVFVVVSGEPHEGYTIRGVFVNEIQARNFERTVRDDGYQEVLEFEVTPDDGSRQKTAEELAEEHKELLKRIAEYEDDDVCQCSICKDDDKETEFDYK